MKYCPECGKSLPSETSSFCDNCGTNLNVTNPPRQKEPDQQIMEEKNPILALICSFFIPGLGQVYDGLTARGIAIFFGTVVGCFIFLIPGLLVWLYGMYDAYSTAQKMNAKEIPFLPTKTAHLILFIILAIFIIALVIFFVFMIIMSIIFAPLVRH